MVFGVPIFPALDPLDDFLQHEVEAHGKARPVSEDV